MIRLFVLSMICVLAAGPAFGQEAESWTCPMHPHYVADEFGACPICGMDLVPIQAGGAEPGGEGAVSVAPEIIQTMGVVAAPAAIADFGRVVRAFGVVAPNERAQSVVAARVEGWIENMAVAAVGDQVAAGQLLYRLYSPDLVAAQADYLASARAGGARLRSAEARLRSLGMQDEALKRLADAGAPLEGVPVFAEAGGTVTDLSARDGSYIKPGDRIMVLQDFSTVWVRASIEPGDLPDIEAGTPAVVTVSGARGPVETAVDYVHPTVDPTTRTGEARLVLPNEEGRFKPGAYADISLQVGAAPRLAVPSEAVLRDGRGARVVLALGQGRFAPRAIGTGMSALGLTEVTAGLSPGEMVVVSGQFLLDSEASLREGLADYAPPAAAMLGPDTPLSELPLDAGALSSMAHLSDAALYLHEAIRDGYPIEPSFLNPTIEMGETLRARFAGTGLDPVITQALGALRAAQSSAGPSTIKDALAALMDGLRPWLIEGAPARYEAAGLTLWEAADGRLWLQEGERPANPYTDEPATRIPWPDPMAEPVEDRDPPGPRVAPLEHDHR